MQHAEHESCSTQSYGPCEESKHHYMHKVCGSCPCGCGEPQPCHMYMWHMSFFVAKKEVMVQILKAKIEKAWGDKMNQTADLIVQSMEAEFKAKHELARELEELWE